MVEEQRAKPQSWVGKAKDAKLKQQPPVTKLEEIAEHSQENNTTTNRAQVSMSFGDAVDMSVTENNHREKKVSSLVD